MAYLLLMIGFYGLLFEVTHPGVAFPGIIGGICLILALMGMQAMSANMAGMGLILLGLALFIAEVFTPSFGGLFLGGLICLILGTLFLYQTDEPYMREAIPYIVAMSVVLGSLTGIFLWKIMQTHRKKALGPYDKLIGELGRVVVGIEPGKPGKVRVYGEIWDAESMESLEPGTEIKVVSLDTQDRTMLKVVRFIREI
jgi:membrane-bound serine protease (ClpP class)